MSNNRTTFGMQTSNPGSGSDFSGISNNEYSAQLNRNTSFTHLKIGFTPR